MINTDPLLSVVMPVYNERTTIEAIARRRRSGILAGGALLLDLIVKKKGGVVYRQPAVHARDQRLQHDADGDVLRGDEGRMRDAGTSRARRSPGPRASWHCG